MRVRVVEGQLICVADSGVPAAEMGLIELALNLTGNGAVAAHKRYLVTRLFSL